MLNIVSCSIPSGSIVTRGRIEFSAPVLRINPGTIVCVPTPGVTTTPATGRRPATGEFPVLTRIDPDAANLRTKWILGVSVPDGWWDVVYDDGQTRVKIAEFTQLFGDCNGDAEINQDDADALTASLDRDEAAEGYRPGLDANGDRFVDGTDIYRPSGYPGTMKWTKS
jgi:hypothetical protein